MDFRKRKKIEIHLRETKNCTEKIYILITFGNDLLKLNKSNLLDYIFFFIKITPYQVITIEKTK